MGLREPFDTTDRTHTVVTRTSSTSNDEGTGWIDVENAVVEVAMRYGTAVHICIDGEILKEHSPETLDTVRKLTRLREDEKIIENDKFPEYRASLPDDADVVRTCLEENEHDGWLARYWGIVEFVVFSDSNWLYHSVPHHSHIREINATTDGFIEELNDTFDSIPESAVFAVGPLASWQTDERRYEIVPEFEFLRVADVNQENWTRFPLGRVTKAYPDAERLELVLRWSGPPETDSLVLHGLQRVFARFSSDSPTRISVPDRETLDEVIDALRTVATKLEYEFEVHDCEAI